MGEKRAEIHDHGIEAMSKRQWGHGYHSGRKDILCELGISSDMVDRINYLKERVSKGHDNFDSFYNDYCEVEMYVSNQVGFDFDIRPLVYGT